MSFSPSTGTSPYSQFTYSVTRILPLPAARIGSTLISYNSYLKELRRYIHYFEVQQQHDLTDPGAAASLLDFKQRSLKHVVNQAYIKKLAAANNIVVTDDELQAEFELLRQQNKLGSNDAVTASVLADFFGMTVDEYLNRVRDELLKQKVIASLDKNQAQATAEAVWRQARQPGADFAQLARDHSDDLVSSAVGGEYGFWLDRSEQNESPKILEAVFSTDVGEVSPIIQTGYRLEIIKVIEDNGEGKRRAAHISFYFSIEAEILRDIKAEQPPVYYLKLE